MVISHNQHAGCRRNTGAASAGQEEHSEALTVEVEESRLQSEVILGLVYKHPCLGLAQSCLSDKHLSLHPGAQRNICQPP